jgi:hypothetical protein
MPAKKMTKRKLSTGGEAGSAQRLSTGEAGSAQRLILFLAGATLFNILAALIFFGVLLLLYTLFVIPHIPLESVVVGFPVLFIAALLLAFVVYRCILKKILTTK